MRRTQSLLAPAVLLALLLLLAGCSLIQRGTPTPPALQVMAGNQIIPVRVGSYCWKEGGQGVCADGPGPAEIFRGVAAPTVTGDSALQLTFAQPPKTQTISLYANQQETPVMPAPGGSITLPKAPGHYLYVVTGRWSQGDSSYVFQVSVP